jgi:tubulin alpha
MSKPEVIHIHIGKAGCNLGNSCWELFCLEQGVRPNGQMPSDKTIGSETDAFNAFFSETASGKHIPRAVYIDLEPTEIDNIRTGIYRDLYNPEHLINGKSDAGNCYQTHADCEKIIDLAMDKIRKITDTCRSLRGFIIYNSLAGGTGSGFSAKLQKILKTDYGDKRPIIGINVIDTTSKFAPSVAAYNHVLNLSNTLETQNFSYMFDNDTIARLCKSKLGVENPTHDNINEIIAQAVSSLTTGMRNDKDTFDKFGTKTLLSPTTKFFVPSYTPFCNNLIAYHEQPTTLEMTNSVIKDPSCTLMNCDLRHGSTISSNIIYKGDVVPKDVNIAISNIKTYLQNIDPKFYDLQVEMYNNEPFVNPSGNMARFKASCCAFTNSTSIVDTFNGIASKFDSMYEKDAFIQYYATSEIEEARETFAGIIDKYNTILDTPS